MTEIQLRGELWDNDSADILRWCGWRDITAPMDIQAALEAAGGDDVTVLVNSPGGDMAVGGEIRSMLRRYAGHTTALVQGFAASAATLAAAGCRTIQAEPGALLCYHNPSSETGGDFRAMYRSGESLEAARDGVVAIYLARPGLKASREELIELMDKDIWIDPGRALEMGLIDEIVGQAEEDGAPAAFVASSGRRLRITQAMRDAYGAHKTRERAEAARRETAQRALARCRALAAY